MTADDDQTRIETMGVRLGYLGLVPFVVGAVAALLSNELASTLLSILLKVLQQLPLILFLSLLEILSMAVLVTKVFLLLGSYCSL